MHGMTWHGIAACHPEGGLGLEVEVWLDCLCYSSEEMEGKVGEKREKPPRAGVASEVAS